MTAAPIIGELRNRDGERLAATFTPGRPDGRELFVIGHGLTSDRTRPWSVALSETLQAQGIASLRLAFSGNGDSEGRFEDSNITKEVEDLGAVLDALEGWHVGYVGHSMGGAVGLLRAVRDERIRALVSLAAIAHTRAFVERMFGHLVPGLDCMLEKEHCPLTQQFLDDMVAIGSVADRAPEVAVPWLLVHGGADDVVHVQDSVDVHAAAPGRSQLVVLDGVDHSFSGPGLAELTRSVAEWLSARPDS